MVSLITLNHRWQGDMVDPVGDAAAPDSFPAIKAALVTSSIVHRAINRYSGFPPREGRADTERQPGSRPSIGAWLY